MSLWEDRAVLLDLVVFPIPLESVGKQTDRFQLRHLALNSTNRLAGQGGHLSEIVAIVRVEEEELHDRHASL